MDVHGRDAAVSLFLGRFEVLGPSNHFTHDKIIHFDSDPDRASGIVLSPRRNAEKGPADAGRYPLRGSVSARGRRVALC